MVLDELEIVSGDFVIIVFQLVKCFLMVFHKLIDVEILSLL